MLSESQLETGRRPRKKEHKEEKRRNRVSGPQSTLVVTAHTEGCRQPLLCKTYHLRTDTHRQKFYTVFFQENNL